MARAAIVASELRDQRRRLRRALGRLELNLVRRHTVERYATHFTAFMEYVPQVLGHLPQSSSEYDALLSEYLEVLWDSGEPKSVATYSVAALLFYLPQLRKQLPRSWKLKAIWDRLELPCQAVPLNLDLLFGFVGFFIDRKDYIMAWGCLLGFNALLRTGELLSLLLSNCSWTPQGLVLHLTDTKGAQRRLIQEESVIVLDELTLGVVRLLSRKKSPGDYLVGISAATFRTRWNHMKQCLHLQHLRFLPYSLRRGGATWFFKETGSFSRTMLRGRWQHLKTCKLYISEAQTALANLSLPPTTAQSLNTYAMLARPHLARWATLGRVEDTPP